MKITQMLMKKSVLMKRFSIALAAMLASATSVHGTDFIKADNTTALNLPGSYTANSGTPGMSDTIVIDGTLTVIRTAALGDNLSVRGISYSGGFDFFISATAGKTLTIGNGGVTVAGATGRMAFNNAVTLGDNQTWAISASRSLQMNGAFSDAGKTFQVTGAGAFDLRGNNTFGPNVTIDSPVYVNYPSATVTLGGANTMNTLIIYAGRLKGATLGNFGEASNFGDGGTSTGIQLGITTSGVLEYTGLTTNSNRTVNRDARSPASGIDVTFAGQTLTLSANLGSGSQSNGVNNGWVFGGAGNLTLSGVINNATGAGSTGTTVTKTGSGTLTLGGLNSYTGATTVSRGTLALTGAGSLATSGVTFNGTSGFTYTGSDAGSSDSVGALTRSAGNGTVTSTYGTSGNVALTFTSLAARTAGATADFVVTGGINGDTTKIVLTGATTDAFIDHGTFFGGSNFAWYDMGSFVRAINYSGSPDAGAVTTAGGGTLASTAHQQTTAAVTAQDNATFATLKIAGAHAITLGANKTVTVNGILKTGTTATLSGGSGIQAASDQDLVVRTDISTDALSINTPILANGANALVKTGAGSLTLGTLAVNTYTGGTFVNQGKLIVNQDNNLGSTASANNIRLNGGTLQANASVSLNANHGIDINAGGGTINGNAFGFTLGTTANMLSGSGPLTITGSANTISVLTSSAAQDYTGPMTISSGRIILGANSITNPYGTGDITIDGTGSIYINNSGSTWANRFFISTAGGESRGAIRAAGGGTFNGAIVLTNHATISSDGGGTTTLNGNISGAFTLTLNGTGSATATSKVTLTSSNSHGATKVAKGITNINQDGALGAYNGTVTINGDGTLQAGASDIILNPNRGVSLGGSSSLSHTIDTQAFNMTIQGAITGASTETLRKNGGGTLTLTGANTYTGVTTVDGGVLLVNNTSGSGTGTGDVTVNSGAKLGGTGSIAGKVTFAADGMALFTNGATLTVSGPLVLADNVVHLLLPVNLAPGAYTLATYNTVNSLGTFASVPVVDSGSANGVAKIITGEGSVVLKVFPRGTRISIF